MSEVAIRCEGLGKRYRIGPRERYYALRDTLAGAMYAPFRGLSRLVNPRSVGNHPQSNNTIWALKDVSFEIKQGEVVGIIGRNGAGKSTLLKILSRITEPTEGTAEIHGRVGSLLEVGTGFHPELTGRENIYLNGAILGMRKAEIGRNFDEIVAFAEVEQFIDTPVKHYSSGMYVRLAFAVAAHLEPDVFLVDEVLAVGDAVFQKKCLGKMSDVAKEGRTVLFVSHNLAGIKSLCQRAILLDRGTKVAEGSSGEMVLRYIGAAEVDTPDKEIPEEAHATGTSKVRVRRVTLMENGDLNGFIVSWKQPIRLVLEIEVRQAIKNAVFGVGIVTVDGTPVLTVHHNDIGAPMWSLPRGTYKILINIENPLRSGFYKLVLGAHEGLARTSIFYIPEAVQFQVLDISQNNEEYIHHNAGLINGFSNWKIESGSHVGDA